MKEMYRPGWTRMFDRLAHEAEKGSTAERFAVSAKGAEAVVRACFSKRGTTEDKRARAAGRIDGYCYSPFTGKRTPVETKTGGTVNYNDPGDNWTAEDVLPGVKLVAFIILPQVQSCYDIPEWTAIMTREDFLSYAEAASRNGIRGTFHRTSPGTKGRPRVLAFQPTPLNKMREAIAADIEAGVLYTLDTYMLEHDCPDLTL